MAEDLFIAEVRRRGGLATSDEAERAVRGVLHALANRLPDGWVHHLAAELPPSLAEPLWSYQHPRDQEVHVDFLTEVAARTGVRRGDADRVASAVLAVVAGACDPALLRRVYQPLPGDILRLTGRGDSLVPL